MSLPRWFARLVWHFRGKRQVRLQLSGPGQDATLEGILVGRFGGHYVLLVPKVVERQGAVALEGHVEVPAERVLFVQVLGPA